MTGTRIKAAMTSSRVAMVEEITSSSSKAVMVEVTTNSKVATISSKAVMAAVTSNNKVRAGRRMPRARERMPSLTKGSVSLPLTLPWLSFKLVGWIHITGGLLGGSTVPYLYHSIPYSLNCQPLLLASIHAPHFICFYRHCQRTKLT